MASFDIREYDELATDKNGNVLQAGVEPALKKTQVTTSGSEANTTLQANTRFVFMGGDGSAAFNWDVAANATVGGGGYLAADAHIFIGIRQNPASPTFISVIDDT